MLGQQILDLLRTPLTRIREIRLAGRALGLGVAAVALAAGSVAASTQITTDPGSVPQATGSKLAIVYVTVHDASHFQVSSVPVGETAHIAFVVNGNDGPATGSAAVVLFPTADCTGTYIYAHSTTLAANGGVDEPLLNATSSVATTMSFKVTYLGDATYAIASGPCRPISFTKVDPTVKLAIHNTDHDVVDGVPFIEQLHASAEVKGKVGVGTNYILVRAWANDNCDGTEYVFTTKNLDAAGIADPVLPLDFDLPGPRSYKARYPGDASYTAKWSDCVTAMGRKLAPGMTFALHDPAHQPAPLSVPIGTAIHPVIELSGNAGVPDGTVTVRYFDGSDCTASAGEESIAAAAIIDSTSFGDRTRNNPSIGSWQATYEGGAYYQSRTSDCLGVRWFAQPVISVDVHTGAHGIVTSATVGTKLHVRVEVGGAFGLGLGKVTMKVADNASCLNGTSLGTGGLTNGVLDDAALNTRPTSSGTIWFQASFKGDDAYAPAKSACVPFAVTSAVAPAPGSTSTPSTPSATDAPGLPDPAPSDDPAAPAASTDPYLGGTAPSADPGSTAAAPSAGPDATDSAAVAGPASPDAGATDGSGWILPLVGFIALALALGLAAFWLGRRQRRTPIAALQGGAPAPLG